MKSVLVKFIDVGRDKKCWEEVLMTDEDGCIPDHRLMKSIRKQKALASRYPEFVEDGLIVAGCRVVGRFEVVEAP